MPFRSNSPSNVARRALKHDNKMIKDSEKDVKANNKAFAKEAVKIAKRRGK